MERTFRSPAARLNMMVIVPMLCLIGMASAIAAVVLAIALGTPWMLMLLLPAGLALVGGLLLVLMVRKARLEISADGFAWGGFTLMGHEESLRWADVHEIQAPPPGSPSRLAAVAVLRDGSRRDIRGVWISPTSPASLLGAHDYAEERDALIAAHQRWLAAHGPRQSGEA